MLERHKPLLTKTKKVIFGRKQQVLNVITGYVLVTRTVFRVQMAL